MVKLLLIQNQQPELTPEPTLSPDDLLAEIARLNEEKELLEATIAHYERYFPPPGLETYTYNDFLNAMSRARDGTVYGAAADYVRASKTEGCQQVRSYDLQVWQRKNEVPAWAIGQISQMNFGRRTHPTYPLWTTHENQFLRNLVADGEHNHRRLAAICSQKFGREITENSIKGKLTRLNLCQRKYVD